MLQAWVREGFAEPETNPKHVLKSAPHATSCERNKLARKTIADFPEKCLRSEVVVSHGNLRRRDGDYSN